MNLDEKFSLVEQYEDDSLRTVNFFMDRLKEELKNIVPSTKDLTFNKEDLKIGKTINIAYRNVDGDGVGTDNVAFEIVVSGFGKNGKTDTNGVMVTFNFTKRDPDIKPLARKKGNPSVIVQYIKQYFLKYAKELTKFDDTTGHEEFQDVDENGTGTGAIAVHKTPLGGENDKEKRKKKFQARTI